MTLNGQFNLSDEQAIALGQQIIDSLGLTLKDNGRVDMTGGDKTPLGLVRTLARCIDEAEPPEQQELEAGYTREIIEDSIVGSPVTDEQWREIERRWYKCDFTQLSETLDDIIIDVLEGDK